MGRTSYCQSLFDFWGDCFFFLFFWSMADDAFPGDTSFVPQDDYDSESDTDWVYGGFCVLLDSILIWRFGTFQLLPPFSILYMRP